METKQERIEKTELLMEDLLIEQFIADRHDEDPEYTTGSGERRHDGGVDVWIEINCSEEVLEELDRSYKEFAKPFEEWAKKNGLDDPEILSTDNSITYKVNIE